MWNGRSPEFKGYKESIELIEKISVGLKKELEKVEPLEFLPLWCFWAGLRGEAKVLGEINSEYLNSPLAWDTETNLPSHPSLVADAKKSCDFLRDSHPRLKAVLSSFSGWAFLEEETVECGCYISSFKKPDEENNKIDVKQLFYLFHGLKKNGGELRVRQMLAVSADNKAHLAGHFSWSMKASGLERAIVIYESENSVSLDKDGKLSLEKLGFNSADEIHSSEKGNFEFERRIFAAIKSFPA